MPFPLQLGSSKNEENKPERTKVKSQSLTPKENVFLPLTWKYKNINDHVWSCTIKFTLVVLIFYWDFYLLALKKLGNRQFEIRTTNTRGNKLKKKTTQMAKNNSVIKVQV